MGKVIFVLLTIILLSINLFGCQPKVSTTHQSKTHEQSEDYNKIILEGEISMISFRNLHDNNVIIFDNPNAIETIRNIISSADKEPGIADMVNPIPEYRVKVNYTDGNEPIFLNLWIGEKGMKSTFMILGESETIYTTSEDMTDQFIQLIEK